MPFRMLPHATTMRSPHFRYSSKNYIKLNIQVHNKDDIKTHSATCKRIQLLLSVESSFVSFF